MAGCPNCGFTHAQLAKYTGKTLKCPKCGQPFKVEDEASLELSEPDPGPQPATVAAPSPSATSQPVTYATTARRAAGLSPKAATGGIGGLIALAFVAFRVYSGCQGAGADTCIRFHEQILVAIKPLEEGMKGIQIALERQMTGQGENEEYLKGLDSLQTIVASSRTHAAGLTAPSKTGAAEYLEAVRAYIEAFAAVVAKMKAGSYDEDVMEAFRKSRTQVLKTQEAFMNANGLVREK